MADRPLLLLLHGALGARTQLAPLAAALAAHADVHALEFEGHGETLMHREAYSVDGFAADVAAALDLRGLDRAWLFGYSMGGYVALHLAATRPDRVAGVVTLGTKLAWTPEIAAREAARLDPAVIRAKVRYFADVLVARHAGAGGWELVLERTAALLRALGDHPLLTPEVLGTIAAPVRVLVGDRDPTVSLEECVTVYRALPAGELGVLPGTPHPLEQVDVGRLAAAVVDVLPTRTA